MQVIHVLGGREVRSGLDVDAGPAQVHHSRPEHNNYASGDASSRRHAPLVVDDGAPAGGNAPVDIHGTEVQHVRELPIAGFPS